MTIEELLKNAGVEDQAIIDAVKAEMPKNFLPLSEHNKRVAAAKAETETVRNEFEAFKTEAAKAAEANSGKESETEKALAELQAKFDKLQGDYTDSQNKHRQRKASDALSKALKESGANPAALSLLTENGLGKIEFGDDGEPTNVSDVATAIKGANAGLFGEQVDTGKPPAAGNSGKPQDDFLAGFGSTEK